MASHSASSFQKSFEYDVFMSFRGEDTRKTFVDHLYHALTHNSINTYKDDVRIEKGGKISEQLIRSIEESRFHIIIFSKNYASSSWCLDELVHIMKCQTKERRTYPVFYDVEPTQVRHQTGAVKDAFAEHVNSESCRRWRDAMNKAAGLAGWELKTTFDGHEAQFIQKIVRDISLKLDFINFSVDENLVGMEARVEDIVSSLEIDVDDVRMIGIKGIGGGGKTTLARVVFDSISILFEGVSFVEDVKGSSLKELQKQVLSDVLNDRNIDVTSVFNGIKMMEAKMSSRKVLIVLDDVDDTEQLQALAGKLSWFKPGSRIIITTRDERVLIEHRVHVDNIHDVRLLSDEEAICLFSRYAFGREVPDQECEELSQGVVHFADHLPLAIRVLGSYLYGRKESEWEDAIRRLNTNPLMKTLKILELSYAGLERDHKEIFLDVACILKGENKDNAIRILESCGLQARYGLTVLKQKSLITISNDGRLLLNGCIEEMGRDIVRRVDYDEPSKHSRLWIKDEIEEILRDGSGTQATRSIKLLNTDLNPDIIMEGLANMTKLRYIYVDNGNNDACAFPPSYNNVSLPNAVQYLNWRNYPWCYLPKPFQAKKLVNLEMVGSNISQIWEGEEQKVFSELKFLDIKKSKLRTFDLGTAQCLEALDLRKCIHFAELHMPDKHRKLKFLNLSGSKVHNLTHINFSLIPNLEKLTLSIEKTTHLPDSICMLKHLKSLVLKLCRLLEQLPVDIWKLVCLEELYLTDCSALKVIPDTICRMKSLKYLHLPYVKADELPKELGSLECLKELNIEGAGITHLPKSIRNKKGLRIVWSRGGLESCGFTCFTKISKYTASCYV